VKTGGSLFKASQGLKKKTKENNKAKNRETNLKE
jgi:hypothetical protein